MANPRQTLRQFRKWWPFALLCLAGLTQLIGADSLPQMSPTRKSMAVASGFVALVQLIMASSQQQPLPKTIDVGRAAIAGVLLLCAPVAILFLHPRDLAGSDLLLAGSLVPLVAAIAVTARGSYDGLRTDLLWPAVAAPAALLLLVTEPRVQSVRGVLTLAVLPVLTCIGAVLLSEFKASHSNWVAAVSAGVACGVFTAAHLLQRSTQVSLSVPAVLLQAVVMLGTFATIFRFGAVRFSAYFVILPLVALLYGFVVLRPDVTFRAIVGFSFLAASSGALLRFRAESAPEAPSRVLG